jgi:hypothetical protein
MQWGTTRWQWNWRLAPLRLIQPVVQAQKSFTVRIKSRQRAILSKGSRFLPATKGT